MGDANSRWGDVSPYNLSTGFFANVFIGYARGMHYLAIFARAEIRWQKRLAKKFSDPPVELSNLISHSSKSDIEYKNQNKN